MNQFLNPDFCPLKFLSDADIAGDLDSLPRARVIDDETFEKLLAGEPAGPDPRGNARAPLASRREREAASARSRVEEIHGMNATARKMFYEKLVADGVEVDNDIQILLIGSDVERAQLREVLLHD